MKYFKVNNIIVQCDLSMVDYTFNELLDNNIKIDTATIFDYNEAHDHSLEKIPKSIPMYINSNLDVSTLIMHSNGIYKLGCNDYEYLIENI